MDVRISFKEKRFHQYRSREDKIVIELTNRQAVGLSRVRFCIGIHDILRSLQKLATQHPGCLAS